MVKLLKAQLNILIHQKGFRFSLFFLLTAVAGNFICNVVKFWNIEQADMYSFLEISLLSQSNRLGWYIAVFFPFLLVLPGGLSLAVDKKTKADLLWISRCGKGRYLLSKTLAVLLVTFLVFFVPFMLELLLNLIAFPLDAHGNYLWTGLYQDGYEIVQKYFLFSLYYNHPVVYVLIRTLLMSVVAAALSIIPLAVSCYVSQYYCHLFIPVYFILSMIEQMKVTVGKVRFDYNYYGFIQWCTGSIDGKDTVLFLGMIAVLFLSAGAVLLHEARKDTV
jgi:hypothetical protein